MSSGAADTRNPNLDLHPHRQQTDEDDPLVGERDLSFWTGAVPRRGQCAGVDEEGVLRSLPQPDLARCTRADVHSYFENTWALTEALFSSLQGSAPFYAPPYHRLRHPLVFYFAHPATFYVNKLRLAKLANALDPPIETLFETGVDEMSWDDHATRDVAWPTLSEIIAYRRRVHALVTALIAGHPDLAAGHPPITSDQPLWMLFMAFEHERIHLETSAVLIRELPVEWVRRPTSFPPLHPSAAALRSPPTPVSGRDFPANPFLDAAGGAVQIGKPDDWPSFGWDNEYGGRIVAVAPFRVQRYLVSNGEFLEFVKAEGYLDPALWTEEGWGWRQFRNARWPTFWVATGPSGLHGYKLRTLFEIIDLPWSWPVEVNCHEARAYCAFSQRRDGERYRLLSEAKHHSLRGRDARPEGNANLAFGSPAPVDAFPASASGIHDLFGNLWQWCEDHFHPLPGFRVHSAYDDFSTPCFDGQHQLILGGSFLSTGDEASRWARYHFRPHFFQHAGFRLVAPGSGPSDVVRLGNRERPNVYEQEATFREYMVLHYGQSEQALPEAFALTDAAEFPRRCAERVIRLCQRLGIAPVRALDLGCAVGRTSFELARVFGEVHGIDSSARFIRAAREIQQHGYLSYFLRDEGDLGELVEARAPEVDRERVRFLQADACALPPELTGFDVVVAANLLCRLPSPRALLDRLSGARGLVRPGGVLFLTTPGTWSETFTKRESWLGGFSQAGKRVTTLDGIRAALAPELQLPELRLPEFELPEFEVPEFELIERAEMPLIIREHRRKYQLIVAEMTAWRRAPRRS